MRTIVVALVVAAVVSCGTDRSRPGFSTTGTSGSNQSALTLRVVDDPSGAIDVTSASSRPSVSLVFEASGEGPRLRFTALASPQILPTFAQTPSTLFVDNVPVRFDRVFAVRSPSSRFQATRSSRDSSAQPRVSERYTALRAGSRTSSPRSDSAQWLRRVTNRLPANHPTRSTARPRSQRHRGANAVGEPREAAIALLSRPRSFAGAGASTDFELRMDGYLSDVHDNHTGSWVDAPMSRTRGELVVCAGAT